MPTRVFTELDSDKRERIINAAMAEFAAYGYENSSTNRIVKECGISKGSLFKYFESKEELYFFLVDLVTAQRAESMRDEIRKLSPDLYERAIGYSLAEFSWYASYPVKGKFIIAVASESDPVISMKIAERYGGISEDIFTEIMNGVDMSELQDSRKEIINILKWILAGFNSSFLKSMAGQTDDLDLLQKEYVRQLKVYLKILKKGL